MILLTSAQLDNYNNRKDKSITLRFITGEKTPTEIAEIHSMLDSFGYLAFKSQNELTSNEIEQLDNLDTDLYDSPKTQSQRLRNVLYLNYQQDDRGYHDFKDYYKSVTENIIQHYKDKLL